MPWYPRAAHCCVLWLLALMSSQYNVLTLQSRVIGCLLIPTCCLASDGSCCVCALPVLLNVKVVHCFNSNSVGKHQTQRSPTGAKQHTVGIKCSQTHGVLTTDRVLAQRGVAATSSLMPRTRAHARRSASNDLYKYSPLTSTVLVSSG